LSEHQEVQKQILRVRESQLKGYPGGKKKTNKTGGKQRENETKKTIINESNRSKRQATDRPV